jgi:hypothetical protein
VLKPNGYLFLTAPSRGHHHSTYDLWRYYPDGMRALAAQADLRLLAAYTDSRRICPAPTVTTTPRSTPRTNTGGHDRSVPKTAMDVLAALAAMRFVASDLR